MGYNYILTVARNWANEGITTTAQVEERLKTFENKSPEMTEIFNAMGIKRAPYVEERALLNKWQEDYGFNLDVILYVCKNQKKKSRFSFEKIDIILTKYFEMKLFSIMEIENFEKDKKELYSLAKEITKALGLYYDNLEVVVENYILKWINMGFDKNLLLQIAEFCFKTSIRTLEGMNTTISKFYKLGLVTSTAFDEYMNGILREDNAIKTILEQLNITRNVNYIDRANYKTWINDWKIPEELLAYAVQISKDKDNPFKYLTKVLADYHEKGIKTIEEAKNNTPIFTTEKNNGKNFKGRSYSSQEWNALYQSIDEIEL